MTLEVAKALFTIARVPGEELPLLAADLLEAGIDSPAIRELAGMVKPTLRDAAPVFERALRELGHGLPGRDESASIIAHDLARAVLDGTMSPREAAGRGASLVREFDYDGPLMPFYAADDDYYLPSVQQSDVDKDVIDYCRKLVRDEARGAV